MGNSPTRNYPQKTTKALWGMSGGQCAFPGCAQALVEPATEKSSNLVLGEVCHIFARSPGGPRWESGLTEEELNAPENLILLCPNHHRLVDGQHATYPAETLREWKHSHEARVREKLAADLTSGEMGVFALPQFPTSLVDQKITEEVSTLRKSRFFPEFDAANSSRALGRRIAVRELSGGSDEMRTLGLAWCARVLAGSEQLEHAEAILNLAKTFGSSEEVDIAEAFVVSHRGDKSAALRLLAVHETPSSRSAAAMIVTHYDGVEGVLDWLDAAGITAEALDGDGKCVLLSNLLILGRWEVACETVAALSDDDFRESPFLNRLAGITELLTAIPEDYRANVLTQPPFDLADFPLATNAAAIEARRSARLHLLTGARVAGSLGCTASAKIDEFYALWLELRDPDQFATGKERLEAKLGDSASRLSVVHLAFQFGIKLDIGKVERDIDRGFARNDGMTEDAVLARLAVAMEQENAP